MSRFLIIEPDGSMRRDYCMEMQERGHSASAAATGTQALDLLVSEKFDAVVMELELPDISGPQLIGEILNRRRDLVIVINTAHEEFRDDFRCWGAEAFLVKSHDHTPLLHSLERTLVSQVAYTPSSVPH